jgi:glycosyl transferase family 25
VRIFLINLDRSRDRLDLMTARLEALGLYAERLPAVDGSKIDLAPYASSGLKPGEIGCFLSHREAWSRLVACGDELGLVLEDDVRLSQNLPRVLEIADKLDRSASILKLDTSGRAVAVDAHALGSFERHRFVRLHSEHTGTAGYIISREAAAELLALSAAFSEPVDLFMFGKNAVASSSPQILQAVPAVVAQEKRFHAVQGTAMASVIRQQAPTRAPVIPKVLRELRRGLRKLARYATGMPSRLQGRRRYIRVPFA